MSMIDRPHPAERFRMRDLGDEILFYDEEGRRIHVLNGTARRLWSRIDGRRTVRDLVDDLVAEYEVAPERAHGDVVALLTRLEELGLIRQPADEPMDGDAPAR